MRVFRLLVSVSIFALAGCGSGASTTTEPTVDPSPPTTSTPPDPGDQPAPTPIPPPTPAKLGAPYPIVLLHGMGGFEKLNLPIDVTYFAGVKNDLAAAGEAEVFVTIAPPFDTSEERAKAIAPQIEAILQKTGRAKVNLIGHSQGGMDARVLASPNGFAMGDRIASVTTVATPHRGSRVADAVLGLLKDVPPSLVDSLTNALLSLLERTVYDVSNDPHLRAQLMQLSETYMATVFNPRYVDDPNVHYTSYAGRTNFEDGKADCASALYADDPTKVDAAQVELFPTAAFLQGMTNVTNDGLVTVKSAQWGQFLQCVPADHLAEVGMLFQSGTDPISKFDHLRFFRSIVQRIRNAGF